MKPKITVRLAAALAALTLAGGTLFASSHMDAPLITFGDPANTTDVYAFRSFSDGVEYMTTALAVYPFEEPGIGPNKYNFDDNVLYEIHVAVGDDVMAGRKTFGYQFRFTTEFKNATTILQSYTCAIDEVNDDCQNLVQTYTVTKVDHSTDMATDLIGCAGGPLIVPPNNQGLVTRKYNQGNDGENPAREGVNDEGDLDEYTTATIYTVDPGGYRVFAGQRDDGFYADIQSIFDLDLGLGGANKPFDSQGGFNVHTIVLDIPLSEIGGDQQIVGVYATTSRPRVTVLPNPNQGFKRLFSRDFVQVGRQGNPLFCEALVGIEDKDLYNRTSPETDAELFSTYATNVQLGALLGVDPDLSGIYIPDLIKVDLSTGPANLAGNPDDANFHRLSLFGGDVLPSALGSFAGADIAPGGFPNGRRFGDDVLDIAVLPVLAFGGASSDTVNAIATSATGVDKVVSNDIAYNKVFPYAATPLNGRNHGHH